MFFTLQGNVATIVRKDQYGVSVGGTFDAVSVQAFGRRTFQDTTLYGVGASYNLGGGASLVGGVTAGSGATPTRADFGVAMRF